MFSRPMLYTCRVKCWDGVTRTFERTGFFDNTHILRHCLARWNGCPGPAGEPYQYFETFDQAIHNDGRCCVPVPAYKIAWTGIQQHDCYWSER